MVGSRGQRAAVWALFLVSGATGLAYEVVWAKYLGFVLGNSAHAQAMVLATFLGGLALGNALFGRRADRSASPLALYGWLEIAIGVLAALSPFVLGGLHAAYVDLARHAAPSPGADAGLKLVVATVALLPATILMGGTLPALTALLADRLADLQRSVGLLYFLNCAGAAAGALLTGFGAIPALGLDGTIWAFAACNGLIGSAALLLAGRLARSPVAPSPPDDAGSGPHDVTRANMVALAAAVSGFVALTYEIAWIRLLSLVIGSSAYAFALMLGSFTGGLALGGLLVRARALQGKSAWLQFGGAQAGAAVAVLATLPLYERLPYLNYVVATAFERSASTFGLHQASQFAFCLALMLAPTVFLGMTLPLAARVATRTARDAGAGVGWIWACNTGGCVLGALGSGLVLLPLLGMRGLFELGVALELLLATVVLAFAPQWGRAARMALVAAAVAAFGLVRAVLPPWDMNLLAAGLFRLRDAAALDAGYDAYRSYMGRFEVLFSKDDAHATVTVVSGQNDLKLRINGKVDATLEGDLATQILVGQIPLLLHPNPRDVLVVGLGSGITAGSVLAHGVRSLDVVEVSPAVVEAARHFGAHNGQALADRRLRLHVDDALAFVATRASRRYDVVINEPSNPWMAGIGNLYTAEYYQQVRRLLAPGGLMVQWVHAYEMDDDTFKLMLRTFVAAFPTVSLWHARGRDVMVVGAMDRVVIDSSRMDRARAAEPVARELARVGIRGVPEVLALQLTGDRRARHLAGAGPLNTLRFPRLEYRAPVSFYSGARSDVAFEADERVAVASPEMALPIYLAQRGSDLSADEFARIVAYQTAQQGRERPLRAFVAEWTRRHPGDARARMALAAVAKAEEDEVRARVASGDLAGAHRYLVLAADDMTRTERQSAARDDAARLWVLAAEAATDQGETAWALRFAREALARRPGDARLAELVGAMTRAATR